MASIPPGPSGLSGARIGYARIAGQIRGVGDDHRYCHAALILVLEKVAMHDDFSKERVRSEPHRSGAKEGVVPIANLGQLCIPEQILLPSCKFTTL